MIKIGNLFKEFYFSCSRTLTVLTRICLLTVLLIRIILQWKCIYSYSDSEISYQTNLGLNQSNKAFPSSQGSFFSTESSIQYFKGNVLLGKCVFGEMGGKTDLGETSSHLSRYHRQSQMSFMSRMAKCSKQCQCYVLSKENLFCICCWKSNISNCPIQTLLNFSFYSLFGRKLDF